jgi:DNA (cytosine-5)-methyltransferase 1
VFVVGCLGGWESAAKVLFESESLRGDTKKGKSKGKDITGYVKSGFGQYRQNAIAGTLRASGGDLSGGSETFVTNNTVGTLLARDYKGLGSFDHDKMIVEPIPIHAQATQYKGGGENRNNDGKGNGLGIGKSGDPMNTLTTNNVHAVAYENHPSDSRVKEINISPTVKARWGSGGGNVPYVQAFDSYNLSVSDVNQTIKSPQGGTLESIGGVVQKIACIGGQHPNAAIGQEVCPTLTNAMGAGGGHVPIIGNMAVRRLTEVECERLQGFPDNYTNIRENCPSGARYKALGNSMAVPVMRWIGERINQFEEQL